ncbi:dTMP kinase [Nonomuraea sp. MG754425]|uniref:dTMP kinase n=1 Tax=Nonomuraea sp. MG754425 TaxID=2570319 RepID=UPI001F0032B1|nr:dTMP kinase [Nonomuraea sp. MG754425]MCF6471510.1 dTMP kinase [Nonomuraea sp. MG754425]
MPGLFITVDGPGGAGKSTLLPLLGAALEEIGHTVHLTREPSAGLLGRAARERTVDFHGLSLACLVAADRFHHLATEIQPALARGELVLCDRYVPSSYVLQVLDEVPLEYVRRLNAPARRPDLALILTAAPDLLDARLRERGAHSRFEHDGSSGPEVRLYDELADLLIEDGFPTFRLDTGEFSPQAAVHAITRHASALLSRNQAE